MTVRDALAQGRDLLAAPRSAARDETPALDADVLLRHVLGISRAALLTNPERPLREAEWRRYRRLLRRRASGEPVAYLTGRREFMGLEFRVNRHVLIPRPETELLVERALAHVGGDGAGQRAIDVGTGSGAIAISLAVARPALEALATDVSPAALAVARANARRLLGTRQRRLRFLEGSLLEPVDGQVDVIAANLPYVPSAEVPALPVSVRAFEPVLALDGGADGLDGYRALLRQAPAKLKPGGALLMECDPRQAPALARLAQAAFPQATVDVQRDLAGRERVVEVVTEP
jgi:release factor glutamine methyltransferase